MHRDQYKTCKLVKLMHHRKNCANILKQWVPVVTIASATSLWTTGGSSL